jgi:uncharacterized protein
VVTFPSPASPRELYDSISSLGIRRWRANPCRAPQTVEGYGEYIEKLLDFWCDHEEIMQIAMIKDTMEGLLGYPPLTCFMKGSCRKFVGFDPDGTVSPCCEMSLDPQYHYGNLMEKGLPELLEGEKARNFWELRARGDRENCADCEWLSLCHGGCTFLRIQHGGPLTGKDYLCEAYKDTFQRIADKLDAALLEVDKYQAA